jgi:hypothetical protein
MIRVSGSTGTSLRIVGHGLTVADDYALAPGVTVSASTPVHPPSFGSTMGELHSTVTILNLEPLANFSLQIEHPDGGEALARKAWNCLWDFSLLALACRSPMMSLYSVSGGEFSLANRNVLIRPLPTPARAGHAELDWAAAHYERFGALVREPRFQAAQRYYNNAHYLFDDDAKIMLLWAGIEGLLGVEAELSRRIALHAAILFDGDAAAKAAHFAEIKKAYSTRSKVVHGTGADKASLRKGYAFASGLLVGLLRKMVELGRVPSAGELDDLAVSASFQT